MHIAGQLAVLSQADSRLKEAGRGPPFSMMSPRSVPPWGSRPARALNRVVLPQPALRCKVLSKLEAAMWLGP